MEVFGIGIGVGFGVLGITLTDLTGIADIASVVIVILLALIMLKINEVKTLTPVILFFVAITVLSNVFDLQLLGLLSKVLLFSLPVIIVVLFREELRDRLITQKERKKRAKDGGTQENLREDTLVEFSKAVIRASRNGLGLVAVFNKGIDLSEYTKLGIDLGALKLGEETVYSVFSKDSLIGEGAVIIEDEFMTLANVRLPSTKNATVLNRYETNGRILGAIGLVEREPVVIVTVSSETGVIGIIYKDKEDKLRVEQVTTIDNTTSGMYSVGHVDLKRILQMALELKVNKVKPKGKGKGKSGNKTKTKTNNSKKLSKEERNAQREKEREQRRLEREQKQKSKRKGR